MAPRKKDDAIYSMDNFVVFVPQTPGGKRSAVWNYFGRLSVDGTIVQGKTLCKLCFKTVAYKSQTTGMIVHMNRDHPGIVLDGSAPRRKYTQKTLDEAVKKVEPLDRDSAKALEITEAIAMHIVKDMRPLSTTDSESFRNILHKAEPRYQPVCRNTILEQFIVPLYNIRVEELKDELSCARRHAITTDGWQSNSQESYVTFTAHFIHPVTYELVSRVLDTIASRKSHTADNLEEEVMKSVARWELKDPVCVTDNAKNIVKAITQSELPHIGCFAHTLNLAVNKCLASSSTMIELIKKCTKIVSSFKKSARRTNDLREEEAKAGMKELMIIQDVETRWNSTLAMMRRLIEIMGPLNAVMTSEKELRPLMLTSNELRQVEEVVELLQDFETATLQVSSEQQPTVSMILPIMKLVTPDPKDCKTSFIGRAKKAIRTDLLSRYQRDEEVQLLQMSTFMDPRFKFVVLMENGDAIQEQVKREAAVLEDVELPDKSGDSPPAKKRKLISKGLDFFSKLYGDVPVEKKETTVEEKIEDEVNRYIEESNIKPDDDPLKWWAGRKSAYPYLSTLAMHYLHIPGTSVPSERVFSTAGNVITQKRNSLTSDNASILIFLHHNA